MRRRRRRTRSWTHSNNKRLRVDLPNWDINVTVDGLRCAFTSDGGGIAASVTWWEATAAWMRCSQTVGRTQRLHSQPLPFITHAHTHAHGERHTVPARWGKSSQDMMKRCQRDKTQQLYKKGKTRRKGKKNLFIMFIFYHLSIKKSTKKNPKNPPKTLKQRPRYSYFYSVGCFKLITTTTTKNAGSYISHHATFSPSDLPALRWCPYYTNSTSPGFSTCFMS